MMSQGTEAVTQARALREQLQKLTGKVPGSTASGAASSPTEKISGPLADAVDAFDKKLSAILGGAGGPGGFGAVASPPPTLGRTSGDIGASYGERYPAHAARTAAEAETLHANGP